MFKFSYLLLFICLSSCQQEAIQKISNDNEYTFGIDVSHYVGKVDWQAIADSYQPVEFAFMRSSTGLNKDTEFKANWKGCKKAGIIRGAYHYFSPNVSADEQFKIFSSMVELSKGDLPPVLDIEAMWKDKDEMMKEIKSWLEMAEKKYGIKPIIYSGLNFYNAHLKDEFNDHTLWIAAYSGKAILKNTDWTFHQFTDHQKMFGMKNVCDGNEFRGSLEELRELCLKTNNTFG